MTNTTLISVIIPCYNQGQFLTKALDSVLAQTYADWECIIINDGSTDNTEEIALKYQQADKRFFYIKKSNKGVSVARNEGLRHAKGDYIKFLDSDDWINEQSFEKSLLTNNTEGVIINDVYTYLEESKQLTTYHCKLSEIDLNFRNIALNWAVNFDIPIHAALISSNLLTGFEFNETIHISEDWIMWLYIFRQLPRVSFINEPLAYYRKWDSSTTTNINKTLEHNFYAYQYAISYFDLDKEIANVLINRIFKNMINKIEFLEKSNNYIKNSTSYKLSLFVVSKLKFISHLFSSSNPPK